MQVDSSSSSSNTYSTSAYSNKGTSGIISGLDTEGMVQNMLQPIQTKIDKQNALKQQLTWKQEQYRDIITKINDFQTKYLSLTSDNCLRSNALFNTMTSQSSSSAVNILSNSSGSGTEVSVQVAQLASATAVKSGKLGGNINIDNDLSSLEDGITKTLTVNLDGIKKDIVISNQTTFDSISADIAKAFGSSINLTDNGDGSWSLTAGIGQQVTLSGDALNSLGFGDKAQVSTNVSLDSKISDVMDGSSYDFKINGVSILVNNEPITADTKVKDIIDAVYQSDAGVSMSFNSINDTFTLTSKNSGAGFDITMSDDFKNFFQGIKGSDVLTEPEKTLGQNAIISIDGTVMERTTNTINYNGLSLELKDVTGDYLKDDGTYELKANGIFAVQAGTESKAEITSSRDTDKIITTVKAFVDDYNNLIEELNGLTHEEATYRKYDPLTADQKKEMSDKEIELWEEKAKTGLLRNDSAISTFLSDMRKAMYSNTGSDFVLSEIGINSSSEWQEYGKLSVDEDKLKEALENNVDKVKELFNGTNGLAGRINDICSKTANKSSSSQGTLVKEAGVVGYASENNNVIYNRLKLINDKLSQLNSLYDTKKQSYWDKFNDMEVQLNKISEQSSWLTNFSS